MAKQIWVIIYLDDGPTGFQVFWEKPTVEYRKTMFGAGRYHNNRWCMEPTTEEELKNDFLFFWRSGILSNSKKTYHASINYRIKILRAIKQLKRGCDEPTKCPRCGIHARVGRYGKNSNREPI